MGANGLRSRTDAHRSTYGDRHRARRFAHAWRRREEIERVPVAVCARVADAEVQVRGLARRTAGSADGSDSVAWAKGLARTHRDRREVQVRRVEAAVGAAHRHRQTRGADEAREPDAPSNRGRHRRPNRRANVHPTMLTCRIPPAGIGEVSEDVTTYRPPPRVCHRRSRGPRPERRRRYDHCSHRVSRQTDEMLPEYDTPGGGTDRWVYTHTATVDRRAYAVGPPSPRCLDRARTLAASAPLVTRSAPNRGD